MKPTGPHTVWMPIGDDPTSATLYYGQDNRDVLSRMPARSVHTVCTSPPYWGLRNYGTPPLVFGGRKGCAHRWGDELKAPRRGSPGSKSTLGGTQTASEPKKAIGQGVFCLECGAWKGDLGLEPTPKMFVEHMVEVFREVHRVLRDDGTLWLNIGDTYWGGGSTTRKSQDSSPYAAKSTLSSINRGGDGRPVKPQQHDTLKPKDLVGIPWRLAIALQDDGWWLRNDIIWSKTNSLPHPVKDRMSSSHEHIFLLTKSRRYYFNLDAIRIPQVCEAPVEDAPYNPEGKNPGDVWEFPTQPFPGAHFACVDEKTDCLTIDGWKPHSELKPGTLAAQYNMATGLLSWAPIEEIARYEVTGQELVAADTRDLSVRLTPNHRTLVSKRGPRDRARKPPVIIEASELKKSHAIPVSAPWEDYGDSPFSPEWAELIGWYMAEGDEKSGVTVEIHQSRSANPNKVARIRSLLDAVDAIYEIAEADRMWRGRPSRMAAFQIRGFAAVRLKQFVKDKSLSPEVLRWSFPLRESLFRGLIDGDGHRRQDDARQSFIQRDGGVAGLVQALGITLGYAAHVTVKDGTSTVFFTEKRCIGLSGTGAGGPGPRRVEYTGTVWCPKLPAGTWVARRRGRAFITGNTFPPALPERCILAGTSDKGVCPDCQTPWHLVKVYGERPDTGASAGIAQELGAAATRAKDPSGKGGNVLAERPVLSEMWEPGCDCGLEDVVRSTILDPFSGSGTTGMVALQLGHNYVGIDLNEDYLPMAAARVIGDAPPGEPLPIEEGSVLDLFGDSP